MILFIILTTSLPEPHSIEIEPKTEKKTVH